MTIHIQLNYSYITRDGTIVYDDDAQWEKDRRRLVEMGETVPQVVYCFDDGSIEVDEVPLKLTKTQRIIVRMLERGRRARADVMEAALGETAIHEMKNPDGAMRTQVSRLNDVLRPHRVEMVAEGDFYLLKKF